MHPKRALGGRSRHAAVSAKDQQPAISPLVTGQTQTENRHACPQHNNNNRGKACQQPLCDGDLHPYSQHLRTVDSLATTGDDGRPLGRETRARARPSQRAARCTPGHSEQCSRFLLPWTNWPALEDCSSFNGPLMFMHCTHDCRARCCDATGAAQCPGSSIRVLRGPPWHPQHTSSFAGRVRRQDPSQRAVQRACSVQSGATSAREQVESE